MAHLSNEEKVFLMGIIKDSTVREERLAIFKYFSMSSEAKAGWNEFLEANAELHRVIAKNNLCPIGYDATM